MSNFKDKTCILISHRIWNIPELKVYFMDNGKIHGAERHDDLESTVFDKVNGAGL